ncbi:unnamed protein product, partial [Symbiodinium necroappetens]
MSSLLWLLALLPKSLGASTCDRPSKDDESVAAKPSCLLNSDESRVAPFFLEEGSPKPTPLSVMEDVQFFTNLAPTVTSGCPVGWSPIFPFPKWLPRSGQYRYQALPGTLPEKLQYFEACFQDLSHALAEMIPDTSRKLSSCIAYARRLSKREGYECVSASLQQALLTLIADVKTRLGPGEMNEDGNKRRKICLVQELGLELESVDQAVGDSFSTRLGAVSTQDGIAQTDVDIITRPVCERLMAEMARSCESKLLQMGQLLQIEKALVLELREQVLTLAVSNETAAKDAVLWIRPILLLSLVDVAVSAAQFGDGVHEPLQDVLSLSEIKQEHARKRIEAK